MTRDDAWHLIHDLLDAAGAWGREPKSEYARDEFERQKARMISYLTIPDQSHIVSEASDENARKMFAATKDPAQPT